VVTISVDLMPFDTFTDEGRDVEPKRSDVTFIACGPGEGREDANCTYSRTKKLLVC
jgi:hypothetical protein